MTFRFVEDTHEYFLDDRRLDGVTEILERSGIADYRFSNEDAMTRGKYVHAATVMIDRSTLDWDALDDTLRPYCEAYRKFIEDARPEILISERPMYHAAFLYAGCPDRVLMMNGRTVVVDIKSGVPIPASWLQISAYRELIAVNEDIHATQGGTLSLQDDGKYRFRTCNLKDMKRDFQIFLAALSIVRWKEGAGI